ncbi:MAG: entericidin A/B family lipoprotein [Pseudomonadota bacterium]
MKQLIGLFVALAALSTLSACNTVAGIGKDIEAAGKGLQSGSEKVEDELKE